LGFPARVGRYELLSPIASGGMATVYRARARGEAGFERDVALKLVHEHLRVESRFLDDLVEEAKLVARIRHPNVVPVIDLGRDAAGTYLVMEYVEGASLTGLYRAAAGAREWLPPGVGLRILIDALSGLHAAHEQTDLQGQPLGLVHRDFSPQNILVGVDGIARLTDFGIAKAASRMSHTRTGTVKGKLAYMAPEQTRGIRLDRRADVWAAGVVAWELLAKRRLFKGDEAAIIEDIARKPIPSLVDFDPTIPEELERAIFAALVRDREARLPNAIAFRDLLVRGARGAWSLSDTEAVARSVRSLLDSSRTDGPGRAEAATSASTGETTREAPTPVFRPSERAEAPRTRRIEVPAPVARPAAPLASAIELEVNTADDAALRVLPRSRLGLGLATGAISCVAIGLALLFGSRPPRTVPEAMPASAQPKSVPVTSLSPEPAPLAPVTEPSTRTLVIESNRVIHAVQVDGQRRDIARGRTRIELEVGLGPHELIVESADGRRQRVVSSDGREVSVKFPARAPLEPLVKNPY